LLEEGKLSEQDALATYTEHIAIQVSAEVEKHLPTLAVPNSRMLITGGGAFNQFLIQRLKSHLEPMRVEIELPDPRLVNFKEALIMALLGVLRWRDEPTTLATVTGAVRESIGGAVWNGS
jgi:anhydro-N-acetylmuramic acid kinase